jgi:hypothetical protein
VQYVLCCVILCRGLYEAGVCRHERAGDLQEFTNTSDLLTSSARALKERLSVRTWLVLSRFFPRGFSIHEYRKILSSSKPHRL